MNTPQKDEDHKIYKECVRKNDSGNILELVLVANR